VNPWDIRKYEALVAVGWVATDERRTTTGKLLMVGNMRDPVTGTVTSLAAADAMQASRNAGAGVGAAAAPLLVPQHVPAAPPALGDLLRTVQLALPVDPKADQIANEVFARAAPPVPGRKLAPEKPLAPWERGARAAAGAAAPAAAPPKTRAPVTRDEVYDQQIAPLLAKLDALCTSAGIGGVVLLELDEDAGDVTLATTQVGPPRLRTEFLERTLFEGVATVMGSR